MADETKVDNLDKATQAAQLALLMAPVFTQLLGAFGDLIAKLHSVTAKKDAS